ncbi:hypothetical protein [Pelobacter seleniigenes]|uniref:hypothetical protein n=1 Tax=Pelobacter seleniigenes TaxID=407188 RepID=UPI0004A7549C|nr:hypothetical protein [Pelobacter seleniigenes]
MYKKIILSALSLCVLLSVTACTSPYVGNKYPDSNLPKIDQGHIEGRVGEVLLDYNISIDDKQKIMTVVGTVQLSSTEFTATWDVDSINLYFLFLDNEKVVLTKENIFVNTDGNVADDIIPFKGSFKYRPEYVYVANGYHVNVSY